MFVWIGKKSDPSFRKKATVAVQSWLGEQNKPDFTGVAQVKEAFESSMFKTYCKPDVQKGVMSNDEFLKRSSQTAKTRASEVGRRVSVSTSAPQCHGLRGARTTDCRSVYYGLWAARCTTNYGLWRARTSMGCERFQKTNSPQVSVSTMHVKRKVSKEKPSKRDPALERTKIFRIENFEAVEVPKISYGQFYEGDSYIVEYTYRDEKGKLLEALIYFWQGEKSSSDEKGTSALLATKFDEEHFNGDATQIRVVQGKEPRSFLALFEGKMIIHSGGCDSGFKNVSGKKEEAEFDYVGYPKLYHVRGVCPEECKALQVGGEEQDWTFKLVVREDVCCIMQQTSSGGTNLLKTPCPGQG